MNNDKTSEFDAQRKCKSPLATRAILYTDTINGVQTCRDDMWAVTTDELNAVAASVPTTSSAGFSSPGPDVSASAEPAKEPTKRRLRGVVSHDSPFMRAHHAAAAAMSELLQSQQKVSVVAAMYDADDCAEARAVDAKHATAPLTVAPSENDQFLALLMDDCAQITQALRGVLDAHDDESRCKAIQFAESVLLARSVPHNERS